MAKGNENSVKQYAKMKYVYIKKMFFSFYTLPFQLIGIISNMTEFGSMCLCVYVCETRRRREFVFFFNAFSKTFLNIN